MVFAFKQAKYLKQQIYSGEFETFLVKEIILRPPIEEIQMGIFTDDMLCEEEIEDLLTSSVFNQQEIEHLYERFKMLDRQSNGYLTYNNLLYIPEFCANPFNNRILSAIERTIGFETLTFPFFLEIMGIFSPKSNVHGRIKFMFRVFDFNEDGRLCFEVLNKIFEIIMGIERRYDRNNEEVEELLKFYDISKKGYMDYGDFVNFYTDHNLDKMLLVNFECKTGPKNPIFPFFGGGN